MSRSATRTYARSVVLLAAVTALTSCMDHDLPLEPASSLENAGRSQAAAVKPVVLFREHLTGSGSILEGVWGSHRDNVYAVGRNGLILHFDGRSWSEVPSGTGSGLYAIWGSGEDNILAVGGAGNVVRFDGSQWSFMVRLLDAGGTGRQLNGIWGSGPNDVWAVGNAGAAYHFDGVTWRYVSLPTDRDMRAVWGTGPNEVFAVGDGGVIMKYDGSAWTAMESGSSTRMNAVWGSSGNSVFAGGSFGTILHYDGSEWREHEQSREVSPQHIREMWGNSAQDVFAVAWGGAVLHHDGTRWTRLASGTGAHLEGIWGTPGTDLIAVGYHGTAIHGSRGRGGPGVSPIHPLTPPVKPIWPLSRQSGPDADSVHSQFGPRYIPAGLDFHAGIDLPAPRGTPAHAVLAGIVTEVNHWNGTSVGAGNAVTVVHANNVATSYLHLDEIRVSVGDRLQQGDVVGTVGSTGATYPHLHLGYFVDMPAATRSESYSRNPLELLAHGAPEPIEAGFTSAGVDLSIPIRRMTVRAVELHGEGENRRVDYYDVVARGVTLRKQPVQFGVRFTPGAGGSGRFPLEVAPDPASFRTDRVVIIGIRGDTLLDVSRGGQH